MSCHDTCRSIPVPLLQLVGWTPLVELKRIAQKDNVDARVVGKLECYQPLCSVKDRSALRYYLLSMVRAPTTLVIFFFYQCPVVWLSCSSQNDRGRRGERADLAWRHDAGRADERQHGHSPGVHRSGPRLQVRRGHARRVLARQADPAAVPGGRFGVNR